MKIKHLFLGALALAATVVGCKPQEINGSKLEVNPAVVEATAEKSDYALTVEADCKWAATTSVEWLDVTPAEGTGNATVTVSVLANKGAAREATVHFQKFDTRKVSCDVTVKQASGADIKPGDGTLESPYLASQAAAICAELESEATTPTEVYVKGYVKKFATKHEEGITKYGNALFYITDDAEGTITPDFYCYQVYYLQGNKFTSVDQIKLGDEVVVYGKLTNYNGTYETVGKGAAYCYSINGQTEPGPGPEPTEAIDVTVAEFLAAEVSTTQYYRISGEVSGNINLTYGNFDVVDETGSVYVYGLDNIAEVKDKLVKGAKITVTGTRGDYNGKAEMMNGHCEKIEAGDTPDPVEATDATVAEFLAAANPDQYYRLTGKVGGSINTTYGNFDLTDATGTVYVYGLDNIAEVKDKLLNGADIVITGTYYVYQKEGQPDKIEVMNGHCEKIEGGDKPEPGPEGAFESSITWTLGANSYDNTSSGTSKQTATINGVAVSNLLKLGKSSAAGTATLHVPAGTSALSFYAYAWKGTEATLKFTLGESEGTLGLSANEGLTGNPPYTMTIDAEKDLYTLNLGGALPSDVDIVVTTEGVARVALFGINPFEVKTKDYTLDDINELDVYYYADGGDAYLDFDLYVADEEAGTWSTLDIWSTVVCKNKTKIAGTYDVVESTYTLNDGTKIAVTSGTMTVQCVSPETAEYYGVYSVSVDFKLANGDVLKHTFPNCSALALDYDADELYELEDQPETKAGLARNGKIKAIRHNAKMVSIRR